MTDERQQNIQDSVVKMLSGKTAQPASKSMPDSEVRRNEVSARRFAPHTFLLVASLLAANPSSCPRPPAHSTGPSDQRSDPRRGLLRN